MRVGEHEVLGVIGRGGMGVVLKCRARDGRLLAAKVIAPAAANADSQVRFAREIRLQAALGESQGFVPLVETIEDPSVGTFLVMPFLDGGSLEDRLGQAFPIDQVLSLGRALASALARAHALGIVHRDLKPANVLFDSKGRPLIADLGLAKHFRRDVEGGSQSASISLDERARGTPYFMPPEQFESAKDVGPGVDVFALGAILFSLLAGRLSCPAYELESRGSVASQLAELRPDAPPWLVSVVARCLAADANARYADGRAVAVALAQGASPVRSRALLGAAGVVVLAGAGLAWRLVGSPSPPPPPALPALSSREAAGALVNLVRFELAGEQTETALALAEMAVRLEPRWGPAFVARSMVRSARGEPSAALADADRAVEVAPNDGASWVRRADLRSGDRPLALADLDEAVRRDPKCARAWGARAHLKRQTATHREDYDAVMEDATRALRLDPNVPEVYHTRGQTAFTLERYEEALSDGRDEARLVPGKFGGWAIQAAALGRLKRYEEAIAAGTEAIKRIGPEDKNSFSWVYRGEAHFALGHLDAAVADATESLRRTPSLFPAVRLRAFALKQRSETAANDAARADAEAAARDFERMLELDPGDPEAREIRAWIAQVRKR